MDQTPLTAEDIAQRLTAIERRLATIEQGRSSFPTRPVSRKEIPTGIRATRRPALWIGILVLLFGWMILQGIGSIIGLFLILYSVMVSIFTKPTYAPITIPTAPAPAPNTPATNTSPVTPSASIEIDIGKRIFSWIGIVALLIGLTFFVAYSFQNFGNVGKTLVGYGVSAILFLVGCRLRRTARPFSYVLEGGAWALAYFMTYATSFVPEFNILNNPTLTFVLLLGVITAMVLVSLREKVPTFTAGAFLLGYGTALLSSTTGTLSLWAVLMLSIGILLVSLKLNWYTFSIGGAIGTYLVFFRWIGGMSGSTLGRTDEMSGIGFLILYALIFGIGHILALPKTSEQRTQIQAGVAINVFLSFMSSLILFQRAGAELWVVAAVFSAILFAFAGATTILARAATLRIPYLLLAIAAGTSAVALKYSGDTLVYLWIIETAVLVAIGIAAKSWPVRVMGYAVGLMTTFLVLSRLLDVGSFTRSATITVTLTTAAIWTGLGAWLNTNRRVLRTDEELMSSIFIDVAIALGIFLIQAEATSRIVSVLIGLSGLLILLLGFALRNRNLRIVSIVVLGYTILRVFIVDVAELDAFGKMISFIVLGGVLLGVAYLYSRSRGAHVNSKNSSETTTRPPVPPASE